jgi:hypothetical protein
VAGAVLCCILLTLALGEALVLRMNRTADGGPFLSVLDLQLRFTGGYDSLFEARVRGEMRQYLDDAREVSLLAGWAREGGARSVWERSVGAVVEDRCVRCHNPAGQASFRRLDSYEAVLAAVHAPAAPTLGHQILVTKVHVAGIAVLLGTAAAICWLTSVPAIHLVWAVRAGFGGMVLDFGSWWLMRLDLVFAWGRVFGNALFAVSLVWLAAAAGIALFRGRKGTNE